MAVAETGGTALSQRNGERPRQQLENTDDQPDRDARVGMNTSQLGSSWTISSSIVNMRPLAAQVR
jgi:hypothetical protein